VPLAANAKITFNGRAVKLADAFWDSADRIVYRFDIVNDRLGDVATEAVVQNSDSSKTMYMVRLKVADGKITEVETIKANKGEADRLWDPDNLKEVSPSLQLSLRPADQDSYYGLIAAADISSPMMRPLRPAMQLRRPPYQQPVTGRIGCRQLQQPLGLGRQGSQLAGEAVLDSAGQRHAAGQAEPACQLPGSQPAWQLQQRERVSAGLGHDQVADPSVQRPG